MKIAEDNKAMDKEGTLSDVSIKMQNRLKRIEFEEKYGIVLDSDARLAEYDFVRIGEHQMISYFADAERHKENGGGRYISWSDDDKQPHNEWIYNVSFGTGAYIFGDDYEGQQSIFQAFFNELKSYNPDYSDTPNKGLYWKIENAKEIVNKFKEILNKYKELNRQELKNRKIAKLRNELESLEKN